MFIKNIKQIVSCVIFGMTLMSIHTQYYSMDKIPSSPQSGCSFNHIERWIYYNNIHNNIEIIPNHSISFPSPQIINQLTYEFIINNNRFDLIADLHRIQSNQNS